MCNLTISVKDKIASFVGELEFDCIRGLTSEDQADLKRYATECVKFHFRSHDYETGEGRVEATERPEDRQWIAVRFTGTIFADGPDVEPGAWPWFWTPWAMASNEWAITEERMQEFKARKAVAPF